MPVQPFAVQINPFLESHWEEILQEAGERCARNSILAPGSKEHLERLKVHAQAVLVSRLETVKGDWLTFSEMEYTLDLFNIQCAAFSYFDLLQNPGATRSRASEDNPEFVEGR